MAYPKSCAQNYLQAWAWDYPWTWAGGIPIPIRRSLFGGTFLLKIFMEFGLKLYVINLPKSVERRDSIESNLQSLGLDYEIFPAVDGHNLTTEQQSLVKTEDQVYLPMAGDRQLFVEDKLSPGEIGCALSHLLVYQRILDSGDDCAAVIEDDCVLTPKFLEALDGVKCLPDDWDLVNFSNHVGLRNWWWAKKYHFGSEPKASNRQYFQRLGLCNPTLNAIFNRRRFLSGMFAYLIRRKACQQLIKLGYPVRLTSDYLAGIIAYNNLNLFRAFPADNHYYVGLASTSSTIASNDNRPTHRMKRI